MRRSHKDKDMQTRKTKNKYERANGKHFPNLAVLAHKTRARIMLMPTARDSPPLSRASPNEKKIDEIEERRERRRRRKWK